MHPGGAMASSHTNGDAQSRQLPTFNDALPFTPFSSIIPFSSDIIPPPLAYPSVSASGLLYNEQNKTANQVLAALNNEAAGAQKASERLQKTLSRVRLLLDSDIATEYKFKLPRRINERMSRQSGSQGPPDGNPNGHTKRSLGAFAQLVHNTQDVAFSYPSPISPPPKSRQEATTVPVLQKSSPNASRHVATPIAIEPAVSSRSASQQASAGALSLSQSAIRTPIVLIPSSSMTAAERAEYEVVTEADLPHDMLTSPGTKRPYDASTGITAAIDQRQKAQVAATRFQTLVADVFEAQITLQHENHAGESSDASRFFTTIDFPDGETTILQYGMQVDVDKAVTKAINAKCINHVPVDDLARVQKLCERTIAAASTANLGIGEGWDERDQMEWTERMALADQGLCASKTILRIMTAGREEKELFSEDTLRALLELLTRVIQTCVIPTVELRKTGETVDQFLFALKQSKSLLTLFTACARVITLLANLFLNAEVEESVMTSADYLCRTLIFVENAGSERDSALGIQKFESIRRSAMDVLANIFARNADQRQSIFDEILISLEKLPVTRQSARQFKLVDSKPIQLVSALLMRLVQTSATRSEAAVRHIADNDRYVDVSGDEPSDSEEYDSGEQETRRPKKRKHKSGHHVANDNLESYITPLNEAAQRDARYVINFLLSRALTSSKSSDEPYRNLLDIFTEDFLSVLGHTDWPGAELLLRVLAGRLLDLTENSKSPAPAKAMALELMGAMLSGITDLQLHVSKVVHNASAERTETAEQLRRLHAMIGADELQDTDLLAFTNGPYRIVLEYLCKRPDNDAQVPSARGFLLTQWGQLVLGLRATSAESESNQSVMALKDLGKCISNMIGDYHRLENEGEPADVSTEDGRLAAALLTMRLPFCKAFNRIFTKMLNSMSSDQPSLRSKSLRSVDQVLEKDPSILDRGNFVMNNIIRCQSDSSPQVRDSALGLLGKCLLLRPKLDSQVYESIILRTGDGAVGVKKRAMKMLKDLYLRIETPQTRARMADALIHRIADAEASIVQLARQLLEEIWITPFHGLSTETTRLRLQLRQQAALMVDIVHQNESVVDTLRNLINSILSEDSKAAVPNYGVCGEIVKVLFDAIVDPSELPGEQRQSVLLQTLAIFAQVRPKLFTSDQIQTLLPYLKNLASVDDLMVYRYAIVILRHTLPHVPNVPSAILGDLQTALMASVQKLAKGELKEVAACLWTLNGMLRNPEKLVKVTRSAMEGLQQRRGLDLKANQQAANQVRRLTLIIGHFASAFDLDDHAAAFHERFPDFKGTLVAGLAIDIICPLTSPRQPLAIRESALESMCLICEAWPKQYLRVDVCQAIELVFQNKESELELVLLASFKDLFSTRERQLGDATAPNVTGVEAGTERLGNTYVATDRDGASTSIAQRFLQDILRIALTSTGSLALTSAQVVVFVNSSGLVHPKESAACLVALETSTSATIANIAFQEHRAQFGKHETMYEKENIRAVQQAFTYQHEILGTNTGYVGQHPPASKLQLFWEVMKTASAKTRKKFLTNICTRLDFEPASLRLREPSSNDQVAVHVGLTRFCVENLAFFDYPRLDELQQLIAILEKTVAGTGTGVAHSIETSLLSAPPNSEVFYNGSTGPANDPSSATMANGLSSDLTSNNSSAPRPRPSIDPSKLRELTASSQVLLLLWETRTYLRRLWNQSKTNYTSSTSRSKGNKASTNSLTAKATKDGARAPTRIPNSTALTERFLARTAEITAALSSTQAQLALCAEFQTLMSVDDELKVGDKHAAGDDDEDGAVGFVDGYETPSEAASSRSGSAVKRGRKRKSVTGTPAQTPTKRQRAGSKSKRNSGGYE